MAGAGKKQKECEREKKEGSTPQAEGSPSSPLSAEPQFNLDGFGRPTDYPRGPWNKTRNDDEECMEDKKGKPWDKKHTKQASRRW